jgi:hypothetical protein
MSWQFEIVGKKIGSQTELVYQSSTFTSFELCYTRYLEFDEYSEPWREYICTPYLIYNTGDRSYRSLMPINFIDDSIDYKYGITDANFKRVLRRIKKNV